MARGHAPAPLSAIQILPFCGAGPCPGHALWVFVHREMYKLQGRQSRLQGKNAYPTKNSTGPLCPSHCPTDFPRMMRCFPRSTPIAGRAPASVAFLG
jgi:hypothetical protein